MSYDQNLGVDLAWNAATGDLSSLYLSTASGIENLLNALARRLSTPRFGLWHDDEYGFDLSQYINADVDSELLQQIRQGVRNECLKDDRVSDCFVTVSYDAANSKIVVSVNVSTAQTSGKLIATIDKTDLTFLKSV